MSDEPELPPVAPPAKKLPRRKTVIKLKAPPPPTLEEELKQRADDMAVIFAPPANGAPFIPPGQDDVDQLMRLLTDLWAVVLVKGRKYKEKPARPEGLDTVARMTRDLQNASRFLGDGEARFLVDSYYVSQKNRIRAAHQVRQLLKEHEPNEILDFFKSEHLVLETQIGRALDAYSGSRLIGQWARSIVGIGPIIVAGLMANIDIHKAKTAGAIWRFAGLDPNSKWLPKTKRPWNASLKRLCFIIGESFTKQQGHPHDVYGKVFRARKDFEIASNDAGRYSNQARQAIIDKTYGEDTDALAWYSGCYAAGTMARWAALELKARDAFPDDSKKRAVWLMNTRTTFLAAEWVEPGNGLPMLPPARIQLRAQRYATKLFLAHFHHVLYEITFNTPPPYPFVLTDGAHAKYPHLAVHTDFLGPPNWPMQDGFGDGGHHPSDLIEDGETLPAPDDHQIDRM